MISPDDRAGRRFRSMGAASGMCFPPGAVYGEYWISIGAETMLAPHVSLGVGLPTEKLDRDAPPVIVIGSRCIVGRGSHIVGRRSIVIDDDVMTGPNVYITDHNHTYEDPAMPIGKQFPESAPVRIGAGSWIGAGASVLPGADIGRNVTVAAGSVVTGAVPDHCVVAGAPARIVRRYDADTATWVPPRAATGDPEAAPADWPR